MVLLPLWFPCSPFFSARNFVEERARQTTQAKTCDEVEQHIDVFDSMQQPSENLASAVRIMDTENHNISVEDMETMPDRCLHTITTSSLNQKLTVFQSRDCITDASNTPSCQSPTMETHSEAFDLLCSLSLLPEGASYEMLSNWWARDLRDARGALGFLEHMSLVEQSGSIYSVLPVIRRYALHPSRFLDKIRISMIESASAFVKQHTSVIGNPLYKAHSAALSAESGNLESILLSAKVPTIRVIQDGLLSLACHQCNHRPRLNVVEHALMLVRATDNKLLHGSVLFCYGNIAFRLRRYTMALDRLEKALHFFLFANDRRMAAEYRLSLENTLRYHPVNDFWSRQKIISQAQVDYESVDDEIGVARCQFALGRLNSQYRHFLIAISLLQRAGNVFSRVKDQYRNAECSAIIAKTYYRLSDYGLAYSSATAALQDYEVVHDLGGCHDTAIDLGRISSACGDYEGSLRFFLRSLEIRECMGLPPSGGALEGTGQAWANLGHTDNARTALEEALHQYSSQEPTCYSETDIIRCKFLINKLHDRELQPSPEEYLAMWRWYPQDHLLDIF